MDISSLPEELVELVASYLSVAEILSCCLVNWSWHRAFNNNRIWFHLCSRRSFVTFNDFRLIDKPCSVVPNFRFPTLDTLEPVCKWRRRFMQEAHLMRNWRHGRHSKHIIINHLHDERDDYNFSNIQCDGELAIIPYSERRQFYLYNVQDQPCLINILDYSLNYMIDSFFRYVDKILVIVQCTLLEVYELTQDGSMALTNQFLFNCPEKESLNIPKVDTSSWYKSKINLYPCDVSVSCDFNGRYFVGASYDVHLGSPHFHIWDVEKGSKIGVRYLPSGKLVVSDMSFTIFKLNLFVLVTFHLGAKSKNSVYRLDLNRFDFSPVVVEFDYSAPYVVFSDKYIINTDVTLRNIYLWDQVTGSLVRSIVCEEHVTALSLAAVSNQSLVFSESSPSLASTLHTVPLSTAEHLSYQIPLAFTIHNIRPLRGSLALVSTTPGLLLVDLSSSSVLSVLQYDDCLWSDPTSSKIITKAFDGLYLLNFW